MSKRSSDLHPDAGADESCTGRLFLVHLSLDADPANGSLCGRIQHLRSEDAAHFTSAGELAHFMAAHLERPDERTAASRARD